MTPSPTAIVVAIILVASLAACDKFKPSTPETPTTQKPTTSGVPADTERQTFVRSAEREMEDLRVAIADLKAKAASASQDAKVRLHSKVEDLEVEWRATKDRLNALQAATAESWKQLNEAFVNSQRHLKDAIENVRKDAG